MQHFHSLGELNGDNLGGDDHLPESELLVPAWAPTLRETEIERIGAIDPLAYFIENMPSFVAQARAAAINDVDSYRVAVGGAALAIGPRRGQIGILTSGNFKFIVPEDDKNEHDPDDIDNCPKVCAEIDIVARAQEEGFTRIAAFAVAAVTNKEVIRSIIDPDKKLDVEKIPPTLEPCDLCLDLFQDSELVDDATLVVTVGAASNVYRAQTLEDIRIARAANDYPVPVRSYNPAKNVWRQRKDLYLEDLIKQRRSTTPQRPAVAAKDPLRIALAKKAILYPSVLLESA